MACIGERVESVRPLFWCPLGLAALSVCRACAQTGPRPAILEAPTARLIESATGPRYVSIWEALIRNSLASNLTRRGRVPGAHLQRALRALLWSFSVRGGAAVSAHVAFGFHSAGGGPGKRAALAHLVCGQSLPMGLGCRGKRAPRTSNCGWTIPVRSRSVMSHPLGAMPLGKRRSTSQRGAYAVPLP